LYRVGLALVLFASGRKIAQNVKTKGSLSMCKSCKFINALKIVKISKSPRRVYI